MSSQVINSPESTQTGCAERNWKWLFYGSLALGAGFRALVYIKTGWTIMDGLISFQFAEQFAAGNGLVFNAGERISGNTSVLYTFILGLGAWLQMDPQVFCRIL